MGVPRLALAVLIVGLAVTATLTWLSAHLYDNNEHRLLKLRAHDAGLVLTNFASGVQTPLASATTLANATGVNPQFDRFASEFVGSAGPFVSISLWNLHDPAAGPVATIGRPSLLAADRTAASSFFATVLATAKLAVVPLLSGQQPRIGYAIGSGTGMHYIAYAESALPADRYEPQPGSSAFADLDYALYLGPPSPVNLLATNVRGAPLTGGETEQVPFGTSSLSLTVVARHSLGGSLSQRLPLLIALVGAVLTFAGMLVVTRLVARRQTAEELAVRLERVTEETTRLYAEQRGIAQTLQHSLLPEQLPQIPGLEASASFEAGARGVEIGGDWYDLLALEDGRALLVVGDVSGRGLRAAATMASLRFAIHAYAAELAQPEEILHKLSRLLSVSESGQLATVLCVGVDVERRELKVASAGHLPPVLVQSGEAQLLTTPVGLPIGFEPGSRYESLTFHASAGATLLAYTDGLIERRDEVIDLGLARLQRAAAGVDGRTLGDELARLMAEVRGATAEDDTAIVGLRWRR